MAAPTYTQNATGNALTSQSLGAGANVTFDLDISTKFADEVAISNTPGGTVAATAGLQVNWFRKIGTAPDIDTEPVGGFVIPSVASTLKVASLELPTGFWRIKLTNLDATNAITVKATQDAIPTVA
jgi:hypothetical protein